MSAEQKTILYVDDDADDRELFLEAIETVAPEIKVVLAENGIKALDLLQTSGAKQSLPCLIVLDLNMPFLNGRETFDRIRANELLRHIPLIILTSGESPADKAYFAKQGATYFNKPVAFSNMRPIASQMVSACH